jgi:hypothetical protein
MSTYVYRERISYFIIGILSVLTIFLLTGAASINPVGKYQMETISRNNITHIYVMDSTTGKVKWVDEMDTPFDEMKGN